MAWKRGESGNPKGKPVGAGDKWFAEALRAEIAAAGKDRIALRPVARALIDKAAAGDVSAINALADRLDGKPAQVQEIKGDANAPLTVQIVRFSDSPAG